MSKIAKSNTGFSNLSLNPVYFDITFTKNIDTSKYDIIYSENYNDKEIIKLPKIMENYNNYDIDKKYLVGELGAFNKLKNICCDYSFNVTNSYTIALLHSLGAKRITLSYELTYKQIQQK